MNKEKQYWIKEWLKWERQFRETRMINLRLLRQGSMTTCRWKDYTIMYWAQDPDGFQPDVLDTTTIVTNSDKQS